jgi:hypothetical protein
MLDWQQAAYYITGLAFAVVAFFYKKLDSRADSTHEALMAYKVHVAETFVTTDQLTRAIEHLNKTVENVAGGVLRIEARLNHQIDNRN